MDKLPEPYTNVLCWIPAIGSYAIGWMDTAFKFHGCPTVYFENEVTDWISLPPPPKHCASDIYADLYRLYISCLDIKKSGHKYYDSQIMGSMMEWAYLTLKNYGYTIQDWKNNDQ